jgi:hypothetical protein
MEVSRLAKTGRKFVSFTLEKPVNARAANGYSGAIVKLDH